MKRLLNKIKDDIRDAELQQNMLAKKLNVSEARITYYLDGTNQMSFSLFQDLLFIIYRDWDVITNHLKEFISKTTKKTNFRECLEWASNYGEYEIFEIALKREQLENKDQYIALVYGLLMKRNKREIKELQFYKEIELIKDKKIKNDILDILLQIATMYAYFDMKVYTIIKAKAELILNKVEQMKDCYIKTSYILRIKELLAVASMKNSKINEAKLYAEQIINDEKSNQFPLLVNSMFCLLSELHIFTDKEKSLGYIRKAIQAFENMGLTRHIKRKNMLHSTHDFIKIFHSDFDNLYLNDKSELAHFWAKQNDTKSKEKALSILDQLNEVQELTPFQLYYRALATGDNEDMVIARQEFYKCGDFYYSMLTELKI